MADDIPIVSIILGGTAIVGLLILANALNNKSNMQPAIVPIEQSAATGDPGTGVGTFPAGGAAGGAAGGCNPTLMDAIAVKSRLQFNKCVTVTGTIVGEAPHYAPDGDMVFALKLDPQFASLVNEKNNTSKYQGGIWVEVVCVQKNKAEGEAWHKGDCAKGAPFYKPPLPKVGNRMKVTGIHAIDVREGGHAEIHPVTSIQVIG